MDITQPVPEQSATQAANADHRVARRQRVLKSAKIVFDDWRAMDCTVRDISETGAKIIIGGGYALPHKFKLLMISENTIRPAQIAWKHNDAIGVAFTGPAEKAPIRKYSTGMC